MSPCTYVSVCKCNVHLWSHLTSPAPGPSNSTQQTLARMAYLENHTSVLLGVFFIVTGVKNWVEHINVRILGLKSVPLRILFPIFCYVHSVKQCWQKHIPPKRGGDTLLSSKIAYPDWNEQAHLIKSKLDQTDQYFLSYMDDFLEKNPKKHSDAASATAARFSWAIYYQASTITRAGTSTL